MLRRSVDRGNFSGSDLRAEEIISQRLDQHRNPPSVMEFRADTGRWVRVVERATAAGGVVLSVVDISDLKERGEQLELSQRRFRAFAQSTSDWVWEMDADLRFSFFRGSIESIMGADVESLIGKTRDEFLLPRLVEMDEHKWAVWQDVKEKMNRRESYRDLVYSVPHPDGSIVHVRNSGMPVFDDNGTFQGYRGTAAEITREVMAEQQNQSVRQRFTDALDGVDAAIAVFDDQNKFVVGNKRFVDRVNSIVAGLASPGRPLEEILRAAMNAGYYGDVDGDPEGFIRRHVAGHRDADYGPVSGESGSKAYNYSRGGEGEGQVAREFLTANSSNVLNMKLSSTCSQ